MPRILILKKDNMTNLDSKIRNMMKIAFKQEIPTIGDFKQDDIKNWDSLNHVELIFMIEEEFNIQLSPEQIENFNSLNGVLSTLKGLGIEN